MKKLGSLFDGSGGFPLAGALCGIEPVWASEVEPYPIAVTRSRFKKMKHLGYISNINGAEIEPVDIITFGSPCQDLSVAGKRAGMKHESNGDEETTRSGVFMEAVRIIKEMRKATNGNYPRFALWENVLGAFSSNKGEDFRTVLEELIKIKEPGAVMPAVPAKGWAYADSYCGDGWSLAYRVFDAQYWGVPQRRRRIYLVLDLRGQRAGKILFEREGLRGYFTEGRTPWQTTPTHAQGGSGADDRAREELINIVDSIGGQAERGWPYYEGVSGTLRANVVDNQMAVAYSEENHPADSRVNIDTSGKVQTLTSRMGTGGGNVPMVLEAHPVYCLQGNGIDRADTAGCNGKGWKEDTSYTLNTIDRPAVVYCTDIGFFNSQEDDAPTLLARQYKDPHLVSYPENAVQYIVRRLTPTECARLQGFPDRWGDIEDKTDFSDEEYAFWTEVRCTHAIINGREPKTYGKKQMLTWYNKLHTDIAEYKMWGNGIALPTALYCMQGIAEAIKNCV